MKYIDKTSVLAEPDKCTGCGICAKVCPVEAISMEKIDGKRRPVTNGDCRICTICVTRCPTQCRALVQRETPLELDLSVPGDFDEEAVKAICTKAHMYPEQVVCYCYRTTAGAIARAILSGAKSPEDVARMTGARTGCGVLCISGVIRLLRAAAVDLGQAPGFQWYNKIATVWDIPQSVIDRYDKEYHLVDDQKAVNNLFPGGDGE